MRYLIIILVPMFLIGCGGPTQPAEFDRQAMLSNLVTAVILPLHGQLVEQADSLQQAALTFEDEPTVETLSEMRDAWRASAAIWKQAELFGLRRFMLIHNKIDKWPTNPQLIDKLIAETEAAQIDAAFIDSIGSTSKGLPAIEYLIFDPSVAEESIVARFTTAEFAAARLAYLVALTANLHQKAHELEQMWSSEGENYAQAFIEADMSGGELQGSINMLANEMMALLEQVAQYKIGGPAGYNRYGEPRPEFAEASRSGNSTQHIINNLRGVQTTFNGEDGLGFDDYLDFLGATYENEPLSARINQQFDETITALESLNQPLHSAVTASPAEVEAAYQAAKMLVVLFKVDAANHLGVTITFSDNDGD